MSLEEKDAWKTKARERNNGAAGGSAPRLGKWGDGRLGCKAAAERFVRPGEMKRIADGSYELWCWTKPTEKDLARRAQGLKFELSCRIIMLMIRRAEKLLMKEISKQNISLGSARLGASAFSAAASASSVCGARLWMCRGWDHVVRRLR